MYMLPFSAKDCKIISMCQEHQNCIFLGSFQGFFHPLHLTANICCMPLFACSASCFSSYHWAHLWLSTPRICVWAKCTQAENFIGHHVKIPSALSLESWIEVLIIIFWMEFDLPHKPIYASEFSIELCQNFFMLVLSFSCCCCLWKEKNSFFLFFFLTLPWAESRFCSLPTFWVPCRPTIFFFCASFFFKRNKIPLLW